MATHTTDVRRVIDKEPSYQRRLYLLVKNGLLKEANEFVWPLLDRWTTFFYFDWHGPEAVCAPLPRVKDAAPHDGVFVVCHDGTKFDLHKNTRTENAHREIAYELGWEDEVLKWESGMRTSLARTILAQAVARPLNQWSFRMAEGTSRAARLFLPVDDPLAREIAALHLVFQLREADFGHIHQWLRVIDGWPSGDDLMHDRMYASKIVDWIVQRLLVLGWTSDRVRKELLEWIWLHDGTHAEWMVAVASASVFEGKDPLRAAALRRFFARRLDMHLQRLSADREGESDRKLADLGMFTNDDFPYAKEKLEAALSDGKVEEAWWVLTQWFHWKSVTSREITTVALNAAVQALANGKPHLTGKILKRFGIRGAELVAQATEEARILDLPLS